MEVWRAQDVEEGGNGHSKGIGGRGGREWRSRGLRM